MSARATRASSRVLLPRPIAPTSCRCLVPANASRTAGGTTASVPSSATVSARNGLQAKPAARRGKNRVRVASGIGFELRDEGGVLALELLVEAYLVRVV